MATPKKPNGKSGGAKKPAAAAKKRPMDKKPAAPPAKKPAAPKAAPKTAPAAKAVAKIVAKLVGKPAPPAKGTAKEKVTSTPPPTPRTSKPAAKGEKPAAKSEKPAAKGEKPAAKSEKAAAKKPGRAIVVKAGTAVASKLGTKWNCFKCSARFYDLNKPEPLCPKCGADQRQRPKVAPPPPPAPAAKKQPRPMAPLLEDEDDGSVRYDEDIDLGVRTEIDEPDEELFQPGEYEEDEPFGGADEE